MTQRRNSGDTTDPWSALMVRAQAGDQAAYAQLLKAMIPVIRTLARRRVDDEAVVEDVIQETLIAVHRVRHTYDPARPFLPWLAAIGAARAIDALRARGRRSQWEVNDDEAMLMQQDDHAQQALGSLEARQQLEGLLGQLPQRQRGVVELVYLREMSLAEAASASSLTLAAVKSLLHRAFTTLRRHERDDHERP